LDSITTLEYHALLAVADRPRHGYAIRDAIEAESRGHLSPGAGTLYRLLARLVSRDLLEETDSVPDSDGPHPGLPRKYYELTRSGREVLGQEAARLRAAYLLAERRLGLTDGTT
jgi:DNA-binding PadR family transcriptional regulator